MQHYFNKINAGKNDCFTLDNEISLVNMAKFNNRVNEEQAEEINKIRRKIDTYGNVPVSVFIFLPKIYREQ